MSPLTLGERIDTLTATVGTLQESERTLRRWFKVLGGFGITGAAMVIFMIHQLSGLEGRISDLKGQVDHFEQNWKTERDGLREDFRRRSGAESCRK